VTLIDARGMRCPWPALRLARALRETAAAVEIRADDPIAPRELAAVAAAQGRMLSTLADDHFRVESVSAINTLFTARG
jgi:tRNA 2-thiouridine synthesizing protein A